jgi:Zinc finger, C2H2 type
MSARKLCKYLFKNFREPETENVKAKESYDCHVCKRNFSSQKKLEGHVKKAHPGAKPYRCLICDTSLTRMTSFKEHMNIHTVSSGSKQNSVLLSWNAYISRVKNHTNVPYATKPSPQVNPFTDIKRNTSNQPKESVSTAKPSLRPGMILKIIQNLVLEVFRAMLALTIWYTLVTCVA